MDPHSVLPKPTVRHKCPACYKQYKKKEHLIEHMRISYHSVHQPKCGVCKKHCKTLESVREHLAGPLPKSNCTRIFKAQGCELCLKIFDGLEVVMEHRETCRLSPPPSPDIVKMPVENCVQSGADSFGSSLECSKDQGRDAVSKDRGMEVGEHTVLLENPVQSGTVVLTSTLANSNDQGAELVARNCEMVGWGNYGLPENHFQLGAGFLNSAVLSSKDEGPEVFAFDCEMVGGGSDGSLDLCARVCLIDENEDVIFHSFVKPQIPVTNYRYEITGLTEDHLVYAMPLKLIKAKVEEILYNGESIGRVRLEGGKARILVGHDLDHDLDCLTLNYPDHLIRDTAKYPPLMKTNLARHSLKYLTLTYLGYEIQSGAHDPYEDCVAALRIYKRMRSELHEKEFVPTCDNSFDFSRMKDLLTMSPDALLEVSSSNYRCWCLDRLHATKS